MSPTLRLWLAVSCVSLAACNGGDDSKSAGGGPTDTSASLTPDPPYNYIPLNDKACDLTDASPGVQAAVDDMILGLIGSGTTMAD